LRYKVEVTIFDLLFLVLVFATVVSLVTAASLAARRQFGYSRRVLGGWFIGAVIYFATIVLVSLHLPRRIASLEENQCFDDICVAIDGFSRRTEGAAPVYEVSARISNRARGAAQREQNLVMYLTDDKRRRFDAILNAADVPFNVLLNAGDSVIVKRTFRLPGHSANTFASITHEGGFPIRWLIIGETAWFHKPPLVLLKHPKTPI
jgi:hypothetical protein